LLSARPEATQPPQQTMLAVFIYMGHGSFVPRDVTCVRVHPSVRVIAARAFVGCHELVEVELSEGLHEIEEQAFKDCKSLKRITLPSSVRVVAARAFEGCVGLAALELNEGLQEISEQAFQGCRSLKQVTLPSSVRWIVGGAFRECNSIFSIEFPNCIHQIESWAFRDCISLRNIVIPPTCQVEEGVFREADALKKALRYKDSSDISEALKHRFDRLPIHEICYYQPHHPPNATLRHLKGAIGAAAHPNATGMQRDCLGMTPLHILACSTKHDMDLYQLLTEKYPNNLITEDKWGDLPILYAFWGNAPREVVQLLVEGHKSYFPDHALGWGRMIVTLGGADARDGIQNLFDTQQNHFSDQNINWEECAVELARSERAYTERIQRYQSARSKGASTETFIFLLRLGVANRLESLGVGKWQNEAENLINECPDDRYFRVQQARLLYSNLSSCEQLKEATWLLELAVWKAKIDESTSSIHGQGVDERNQCRINCGVQQILPIVVSFLLPKWEQSFRVC